jgi:hypothetical protein
MPDGCVDLFVSSRGEVMIAGPATTFYDLRPDKGCVLAGLRLRTGMATAVLARPVSEFTDQQVLLDSILGVHDFLMAEKVLAATTPSQRVAAPQNVLTGYLADTDALIDTAVTRAIGMMRRHPDRPVSGLAVAVDLSERQPRRRFETAVGYGPKRLAGSFDSASARFDPYPRCPNSVGGVGGRGTLRRPAAHDQRVPGTGRDVAHRASRRRVRFVQYGRG